MKDFLDIPFDTAVEEASPAFAPIPRDLYKAEIVKAMADATKNGKGYQVSLNWSIIEGEYENRTIFQNILIQHESEEAQKIGRQKFQDVCLALGVNGKVEDLKALHNIPCQISVVVRSDKDGQYPDRNEVMRVRPLPKHNGPTPTSPPPKGNGSARDLIKEAQKTQPAFKAVHADMNDEIPF
jgi:Protein of unknown function (DUF669)